MDEELRNDADYAAVNENNQSDGPFSSFRLNTIFSAFPPDSMHLVYLGVTRRLFHYYFTNVNNVFQVCRVPPSKLKVLNEIIENSKKYFPKEFNRTIRTLDALDHFKASEFRNFLMYAGPVIFKKFLHKVYYDHFLLLHFSMYVFSSPFCSRYFPYAKASLRKFLRECNDLFGKQIVTYNFHVLSHLPLFISLYGTIDTFSCFPFENHLSILKRRIKSSSNVFKHSINTLDDIRQIFCEVPTCSTPYFSSCSPNNCAILNDNSLVMIDIVKTDGSISGHQLMLKDDLYSQPYPSRYLHIGIYSLSKQLIHGIPLAKCVAFPVDNHEFVIIPLVLNERVHK
jgi:hypothetical protein